LSGPIPRAVSGATPSKLSAAGKRRAGTPKWLLSTQPNACAQVSAARPPTTKAHRPRHAGTSDFFQSHLFRFHLATGRNPYEAFHSQTKMKCYKTFLQSAAFLMHTGLILQINGSKLKLPMSLLQSCAVARSPEAFHPVSLVPFPGSTSFRNGCPLPLLSYG